MTNNLKKIFIGCYTYYLKLLMKADYFGYLDSVVATNLHILLAHFALKENIGR